MDQWSLLNRSHLVLRAESVDDAGVRLSVALANRPEVRTISLLLDPSIQEITPWLRTVRAATPEKRGMLVQRFFARLFVKAGYDVIVGREFDIFARGKLRSLFVEVKSSLRGGNFGSRTELIQLDAYLTVAERRRAERWLGVTGINKPMRLASAFRAGMLARNIGLLEIRWISSNETLLPHLLGIS